MSEPAKRHPRRSDDEWLSLIQECRTSGMSDKSWCESHHICTSKFYYHIKRLRAKACIIPDNPGLQSGPAHQEIVKLDFNEQMPDGIPSGDTVPVEIHSPESASVHAPVNDLFPERIHTTPAVHLSFGKIGVDISNSADRSTILNTLSVLLELC